MNTMLLDNENNTEIKTCSCGGTMSKAVLNPPRAIPGQPNHPQTVEYTCSKCGKAKLVNCKTDGCIGKIRATPEGILYCPVCEELHSVDSPTTVTFW